MPDDERSLAGVRVLVTRAADRSDAFAELLRERGAEPVAAPLIELHVIDASEELDAAAASLPAYDFVAFTSAAAVAPFLLAMAKRNASVAPHSKVVAVGPTTAAALEAAGLRVTAVAEEHRGEGIADVVVHQGGRAGMRLLLPRARVAREVLPEALREAGLVVDVLPVYETRTVPPATLKAPLLALSRGDVDAVTFTSASTVDSFVAIAGDRERAVHLLSPCVVGSIGPLTTEAAARHGIRVDVTAEVQTAAGLAEALGAYFVARVPHKLRRPAT